MNEGYIYDESDARFKKEKRSSRRAIRRYARIALAGITLSILYYVLFALFFSTATERRLKKENRALTTVVPQLEEKERLMSDVILHLNARDNAIYEEIFKAAAPHVSSSNSIDLLGGLDTIPDRKLVGETGKKLDHLMNVSQSVEETFREIAKIVDSAGFIAPPMNMPMKNVSFAQVGASVGMKMNPFYKMPVMHDGLDIISSPGELVYAAAGGVVSDVTRSRKGLGNVVTIKHKGGYYTRYAHLGDIYVDLGMTVRSGQKVGAVGVANNNSYAPHLHYMVKKDSVALNPVNFFHVSVHPEEYANMMIMSAMTGQSMD